MVQLNQRKATGRLAQALQKPISSIVMDAKILRFEFTYELRKVQILDDIVNTTPEVMWEPPT